MAEKPIRKTVKFEFDTEIFCWGWGVIDIEKDETIFREDLGTHHFLKVGDSLTVTVNYISIPNDDGTATTITF